MGVRATIKVGWLILRYGLQGAVEKVEEELASLKRKQRWLQEEHKRLSQQLHELQEGNH